MIQSQHVSRTDLMELIAGEGDSEKTRSIGQHLHQCEECRQELDALTAQSVIWEKAPVLLKDAEISDSIANPNSDPARTVLMARSGQSEPDEPVWQYPIDELLDTPRHPEMMGRIGKYEIEREIGRGGMGVVLKAHDSELNRPLAIKILAPHLASHGTARKRFAQEARAAAGVLHPNVIAVHDVNNEGKTPYIVMPYISGPSLQVLIDQQGPLPEIEIVRVALQIAAGLTPAHAQGLVHRDIKPANILVEEGVNRVIITDFGLARAEDDASLTRTGWLTGTPNYMSPEQARGERMDQRSDLFSLGSLIYFMATGRLPFRSDSPLGVLSRIQKDEPTPVRQVNNQISKTLSNVIELLLRKDPDKRFQSAGELHDLLERHLAWLHQPDISRPPKVPVAASSAGSKRWLAYAAVVPVLLITALALYGLGVFGGPDANNDNGQVASMVPPSPQDGDDQQDPEGDSNTSVEQVESELESESANEQSYVVLYGDLSDWHDHQDDRDFEDGFQLLKDGNYEEAIAKFQRSSQSGIHEALSAYNIGCAWALKDKKDKAFAALNQAIELGFVDKCHIKSDEDLDSLRDDERFAILVGRIEEQEEVSELVSQARNQASCENYARAEALCLEALELDPDNAEVFANLGYALHMRGNLEEAIPWHLKAANTETQAALGNYNMGCVHSLRNEPDQAFDYLDKAIETGLAKRLSLEELQGDPDLDNIRDDDRYQQVVEELEALQTSFSGLRFYVGDGNFDFTSMISITADEVEEVEGSWECRLVGDEVDLTITRSTEDNELSWSYSSGFAASDFTPPLTRESTDFRLVRKYGQLVFSGSFSGRNGEGDFHFEGDDEYRSWLIDQGIEYTPNALLFRLFMSWQDEEAIVANLQELQEFEFDKETMAALMVHGVSADLIREYQKKNLAVPEHLKFVVWRVPGALIVEYNEAGLDPEEHAGFINKRVPADLLMEYDDAGYDLVEFDRFITWRVEPNLLQQYERAGFSTDEFASYINLRVPAQLLADYQKAGLELGEHESFIDARVEPELLIAYTAAGYDSDEYERFIRHHVPVNLLVSYSRADLDINEFETLIQARVVPGLIIGYRRAELLTDDYEVFLKNKVPVEVLTSYLDSDFDPQEHQYFIQHQIPVELLKRYEEAGLDLDEHRDFIQRRMEPEKVLKYLEGKEDDD
ncbi:MAG: protein kinase domain-containing protein [Pirellulaceae bacterium]